MRRTWCSCGRSGSTRPPQGCASRPALALLARRQPDYAEGLLTCEIPWLTWLPAQARHTRVRELLADLVAGADTGHFTPFARNLASWRSTAEVWSDPKLARELRGPFDGDGPVLERPGSGAA